MKHKIIVSRNGDKFEQFTDDVKGTVKEFENMGYEIDEIGFITDEDLAKLDQVVRKPFATKYRGQWKEYGNASK